MGASEAQEMANDVLSVEGGHDPHYGARTVPSKPIEKVDRTERPGEDTTLTDRVHAAASTHDLDEEVAEILRTLSFDSGNQNGRASKQPWMRSKNSLMTTWNSDQRTMVDDVRRAVDSASV